MAFKLDVTEPDYKEIKKSLIEFLKTQSEFADYNFEGSGIAALVRLLAHNTAYNAFYINMVASEMFLDSAIMRESVVSRAKMLGYTPRSARGAVAYLNIKIVPADGSTTVTIPRGIKFVSTIDNDTFTFSTIDGYVVDMDDNGEFIFTDVPIVEGEPLTFRYTVSPEIVYQRFVLPEPGVDTTTIRVRVQESVTNLTNHTYSLGNDLNDITAESKVYFIQEIEGGKHEIYFGDGVVGSALASGNIVIVDYLLPSGEKANGLSTFTATNHIGIYPTFTLTTTSASRGGSTAESIDSIKYLAPLWYESQGRAVTKKDYEALLKKDYPNIDSLRIWGGEENDPPYYGKVFVSIKPLEGLTLSNQVKEHLVNNILKKRNIISVDVDIVDPDYIYIVVDTKVKWKSNLTSDSKADVVDTIRNTIKRYGEEDLDNFDTYFRYSKFVRLIDNCHVAIQNNLTNIRLRYRLVPSLTQTQNYIINFSNAIDPNKYAEAPTLSSTSFTLDGHTCYFQDNGAGVVQIYRFVEGKKVIVRENIGSINYTTGTVQIDRFLPTALKDNLDYIIINVRPLSLDIATIRNQLLLIDDTAITINLVDESV